MEIVYDMVEIKCKIMYNYMRKLFWY